jgi:hypothetical protein
MPVGRSQEMTPSMPLRQHRFPDPGSAGLAWVPLFVFVADSSFTYSGPLFHEMPFVSLTITMSPLTTVIMISLTVNLTNGSSYARSLTNIGGVFVIESSNLGSR